MTNPSRAIGPTATPKSGLPVGQPITVLLISAVSLTLLAQAVSLLNGWNLMPAKVLELILLLGGATLLTGLAGG